MDVGLEVFHWRRPAERYEWENGKAIEGQQLSEDYLSETRFLVPRSLRYSIYNPLVTEPTLYRQFAGLEPTEAAFAEFASTYGDLGLGVLALPPGVHGGPVVLYDPLCRWRIAHWGIRPVVEVLNVIQAHDMDLIKKWFRITEKGAFYERDDEHGHAAGWVAIPEHEHRQYLWDWAMRADSDDDALIRVARGWAQEEINAAMSGSNKGTLTNARVLFEADSSRMSLHIVPRTLIGAMWLQCARVLTLHPTFKSCEHCSRWFEFSAEGRRRQSKYCSSRCKVAAYRARKAGSTN